MPRIPQFFFESVVYLYPDKDQARSGGRFGGSGVLISEAIEAGVNFHVLNIYAITNAHVIKSSPVVRINRNDGGFEVFEFESSDWTIHKNGIDVAARLINPKGNLNIKFVPREKLITEKDVERYNIGPGDETLMVGRFINQAGRQRNTPSARFGNIAMSPCDSVADHGDPSEQVFLVETRSLPGYSGSPVFLIASPFTFFEGVRTEVPPGGLLGIDLGHTYDELSVLSRTQWEIHRRREPIDKNWFIQTNAGMAHVLPAWKINELLDQSEFEENRSKARSIHIIATPISGT